MKLKVAAFLVIAALPGIVASSWLALPLLVDRLRIPVPLETLQLAATIQSAALVFAAALIGAFLAPRIGLAAPAITAFVDNGRGLEALRSQLVPGIVGGCAGAGLILGFHTFAPESLVSVMNETRLPLAVRILYGGITEEVLVRWGLMTAMAWTGWKILRRDLQQPTTGIMWMAIGASALVFGVSHIPAVAQILPTLSASVVAYITIGNALFGLVAGYLFWRHGLEAAIVAHISAHLLAFAIRG